MTSQSQSSRKLSHERSLLDLSTSPSGASTVSGASGSVAGSASCSSVSASWSTCAVCQDTASGVHYGVPACEGCKGFFRRIVSSRNPAGACSHESPLVITPQTRNACQWCRLKKCCAVNMGRQRSKLGRRARADNGKRPLPASPEPVQTDSITNQQLLRYVELKRREFEGQVHRRTCFRRNNNSWKTGHPRVLSSPATCTESTPLTTPTVTQSTLNSPQGSASQSSGTSTQLPPPPPPPHLPMADKLSVGRASAVWLSGCQPLPCGQSLTSLCQRLAGDARSAAWLRSRCDRPGLSGASAKISLRAVDKFVQYWEADLNNQFSFNPGCGREIAHSTELIVEGHRRTAYYCKDRMTRLMAERRPLLRQPTLGEEPAVLNRLVGSIPQLMLRIVAFARNILGGSGGSAVPTADELQQQTFRQTRNQEQRLASRCSDVLLDADKRRLIVHHCFKVIAMRFCDALVRSDEDFIIDPSLHYRLTKDFLVAANHPMLSQLFLKFFEVSRVWDSLNVSEHELAFLSAICLTSPFLDSSNAADSKFDDASAVVSVHSAVIGLFWIHLRSAEITSRGCTPAMVKSDSRLNLDLRIKALRRILELSDIFDVLLSVDGLHRQNSAMIESIVERLSSAGGCDVQTARPDGFPDFSAAFNSIGQAASADPELLHRCGAGVYAEVFGRPSESS